MRGERRSLWLSGPGPGPARLSGETAVRFYSVYSGYCLAFASATSAGRLIGDVPSEIDSLWIGDLGRIETERHPHLAEHAGRLMELRDRTIFLTGIDVILDAIEAAARAQ